MATLNSPGEGAAILDHLPDGKKVTSIRLRLAYRHFASAVEAALKIPLGGERRKIRRDVDTLTISATISLREDKLRGAAIETLENARPPNRESVGRKRPAISAHPSTTQEPAKQGHGRDGIEPAIGPCSLIARSHDFPQHPVFKTRLIHGLGRRVGLRSIHQKARR